MRAGLLTLRDATFLKEDVLSNSPQSVFDLREAAGRAGAVACLARILSSKNTALANDLELLTSAVEAFKNVNTGRGRLVDVRKAVAAGVPAALGSLLVRCASSEDSGGFSPSPREEVDTLAASTANACNVLVFCARAAAVPGMLAAALPPP